LRPSPEFGLALPAHPATLGRVPGTGELEDTMGDKGGKKDKEKSQKQKTEKKVEQGKAKQEKQVKK
jgi:hypothetical protein